MKSNKEKEEILKIAQVQAQLIENIKWRVPNRGSGGQVVGLCRSDVTLVSEEVNFEITIGYYRSQIKNKELALTLFRLYLDEIIK